MLNGLGALNASKYVRASRASGEIWDLYISHSTPNSGMLIKLNFHKDQVNPRLIASIS
jgi:hypothetical protein